MAHLVVLEPLLTFAGHDLAQFTGGVALLETGDDEVQVGSDGLEIPVCFVVQELQDLTGLGSQRRVRGFGLLRKGGV